MEERKVRMPEFYLYLAILLSVRTKEAIHTRDKDKWVHYHFRISWARAQYSSPVFSAKAGLENVSDARSPYKATISHS